MSSREVEDNSFSVGKTEKESSRSYVPDCCPIAYEPLLVIVFLINILYALTFSNSKVSGNSSMKIKIKEIKITIIQILFFPKLSKCNCFIFLLEDLLICSRIKLQLKT